MKKLSHWRLNPAERKAWVNECWTVNNKTCPLCARRMPRDTMVSDHCHGTGTPRAALCRRCNGLLGHMETSGKTDAQMLQLFAECGLRAGALDVIGRMRMYLTAWQPIAAAHLTWRKTWGISKGRSAPNRFVLAVWAGMATSVLRRNPSASRAMGIGGNPIEALLRCGAARHRDKADAMRVARDGAKVVISLDH
ncbi:endonuclease domain-containing protein [Paraburkholderia strydomiana]|uniref:endonuclease domain-containing protein n=1 Tax=Paraburkholderia strydomiana TaxID=1245417 RepID=UPI0038BA3E1B